MVFSRNDLHRLIKEKMSGYRFIVVANREPFIHRHNGTNIAVVRPASGMASALHPVMLACDGTWVGHGSGDADRAVVDEHDRIRVPPEGPRYTLRRVWLSPEQEEGYYYGLANSGLWPLCQITFTRPRFAPLDWEYYREVNRLFAEAVLEEAGREPAFVFIQDFHFCLLPRMLKTAHPGLIIAQFWHIPWPNREVFRTFPWGEELLDGLLGNDLLGFHVHYHCQNFLQVAVPSRTHVPAYRQIAREVDLEVSAINERRSTEGWEPVTYIKEHQGPVGEQVERNNVYRWAGRIISSLLKFDFPDGGDGG